MLSFSTKRWYRLRYFFINFFWVHKIGSDILDKLRLHDFDQVVQNSRGVMAGVGFCNDPDLDFPIVVKIKIPENDERLREKWVLAEVSDSLFEIMSICKQSIRHYSILNSGVASSDESVAPSWDVNLTTKAFVWLATILRAWKTIILIEFELWPSELYILFSFSVLFRAAYWGTYRK